MALVLSLFCLMWMWWGNRVPSICFAIVMRSIDLLIEFDVVGCGIDGMALISCIYLFATPFIFMYSLYHFCSIINALVSRIPLWWWRSLFVDRCRARLLVCDAKWQLYGGVHHIFVLYAFLFNFVSLMVYVYLCLALLFISYWYCPSLYLDPLAILFMY